MTICHVTSMHEYNDDRIFERACKGLVSLGYIVKLIATYDGNNVIEDVEIIGLKKRKGLSRRLFTSWEAYKKSRKTKADIFHFHDPDLIPWMVLLALSGRKVIYDVHENYESRIFKLPLPKSVNGFLAKCYRWIENGLSSYYSGVTVVTDSMMNLFKNFKKPITVTNNVVYIDRLESINIIFDKESTYTIYTSGTNSPSRNCMQTIEALPIILDKVSNVEMRFVGRYYPDYFKETLRERAEEIGVANKVIIEDMLPWEDNFLRTAKYHIGCVFYQDNLNNRVTLPNRLFEYMFCKVAVLGEDYPEVSKVLEETQSGLTVNSNIPESIAEKAIYLLQNPEEMLTMGENGRKAVLEKYNFENELVKIDEFYRKIAG